MASSSCMSGLASVIERIQAEVAPFVTASKTTTGTGPWLRRSVLLCGPPGCRKSLVAQQVLTGLAEQHQLPRAFTIPSEQLHGNVALDKLLAEILAGDSRVAIVVFEDMNRFPPRITPALREMLTRLAGQRHVLVIGTTTDKSTVNYSILESDAEQPAIVIDVPLPDASARADIFCHALDRRHASAVIDTLVTSAEFTAATHNLSGRAMMRLAQEAARHADTAPLSIEHVLKAHADIVWEVKAVLLLPIFSTCSYTRPIFSHESSSEDFAPLFALVGSHLPPFFSLTLR